MRVTPLGETVSRRDGVLKVTGGAKFAAEHHLPNLAHAAVVYSTIPKGRIQKIETAQAEKALGVLAVITHDNGPKLKKTPSFNPSRPDAGSAGTMAPILGDDVVYWNGFPMAIVVAETLDQAEAAAQLIDVTYKSQEAALVMEAERDNATTPKNLNGEEPEVKKGDASTELAKCSVIVGATYRTPPYNHNPIEPHAVTAHWESDEQLTVYDASQYIVGTRNTLATMFGLKPDNVRVFSPFVGGGFGSKVTGRPVQLALSREGVFRIVGGRTPTEQQVAIGCDESGKIGALLHSGLSATSTTNEMAEPFTFPARHLYATPNMELTQKMVRLDTVPNTFMRAPGESVGSFALESAMDELAYAANIDPIELRLLNDPERDPAKDIPFSARHFKEVFKLGAEKFGWDKRPMAPRSMRDGDTFIGWGVASALYPVYQFPSQAQVVLCSDGTAWGACATHELGTGTTTAQAIHLAKRLGLPVEKARFELGDTKFPQGGVSGGSSTTISVAAAVENGCDLLIEQLLALVKHDKNSPLRGVKSDDVVARDEGLWLIKEPSQGETYSAILSRHGQSQLEATGSGKPGLEQMRYSMNSYGAQFCEVRVNEDSGEIRISRWVAAFDTGRILNPKTALSQFRGGIIMGIGMALMEETQRDARTARIMNPSLAEYHVPVNLDVPNIEAYFLDIPDPQTPVGAHGIGEIGITGAAAAVANAVFHATGKRIRELPITLDKLL